MGLGLAGSVEVGFAGSVLAAGAGALGTAADLELVGKAGSVEVLGGTELLCNGAGTLAAAGAVVADVAAAFVAVAVDAGAATAPEVDWVLGPVPVLGTVEAAEAGAGGIPIAAG